MKANIILALIFISFTFLAYSGLYEINTERIGGTQLNGSGCVCHSMYEDINVKVWIEGPDTLAAGQKGLYKIMLSGGPAEAGGYNVAARSGVIHAVDTFSVWDYRAPNELTQSIPLAFQSPQDTISWLFEYTAPGKSDIDTLYSVGLSIVYDSIPDEKDRWAFGPKFPVTIIHDKIPVELVLFISEVNDNFILLKWTTAGEINNMGFEIERMTENEHKWEKTGFVPGQGTTTGLSNYTYTDRNPPNGTIYYRLKQIDYTGRYEYSDTIEVRLNSVLNFELSQNFPNPFNPVTKIKYSLETGLPSGSSGTGVPSMRKILLKVYDVLGNDVATLVNEAKPAGEYTVDFNGSDLAGGIYFCKIEITSPGGDKIFSRTKKMLLLK